MTDRKIDLTRRSVLASLGTVGLAGAGAGLGTTALFSDRETFDGNTMAAGEFDLKVDWEEHYYDDRGPETAIESLRLVSGPDDVGPGDVGLPNPNDPMIAVAEEDVEALMDATVQETSDDYGDPSIVRENQLDLVDDPPAIVTLDDVKPGDYGELTLSYHLFDNPGYVTLCAELLADDENGVTEPESELDDPDDPEDAFDGELGEHIQAALWYDPNCSNTLDGEEEVLLEGTLNEVLAALGATLDGTPEEQVAGDCLRLDPVATGGRADDEFGEWCHAPGDGDCTETLYLIENTGNGSRGDNATPDSDDAPFLFEVTLDTSTMEATLTDLRAVDGIDAGHIAATPDGDEIYIIDRDPGTLVRYDIASDAFTTVGTIADHPDAGGVVLAAFSPDGTLYMASNETNHLYRVDDHATSPQAVDVGDTGINVQGADIAFDASGTLFLYSNATQSLYTLDPSTGDATEVGPTGVNLTGLAVRGAGTGDLVGSATSPDDEIVVFDKTDGSVVERYPMTREDESYDYDFGDMTVGGICPTHCVALAWWLPRDVGNVVQSDSLAFRIGFYTEQCRDNDTPPGYELN